MEELTVSVEPGSVELVARVEGAGPVFVWAHPLLSSMASEDRAGMFDWSRVPARLVRYDARSHGGSEADRRAGHHRWATLAGDMLAVADNVGDGRPSILGGASMGAATAIWAAHLAPERVRALVIVIPPTAHGSRQRQSAVYRGFARLTDVPLGFAPVSAALRIPHRTPRPGTRAALTRSVLDDVGRADPKRLTPILQGAAGSDLPPLEDLAALTMPTLVLAWKGDRSHPLAVARELAATMPGSELHVAQRDPTGWSELVSRFVERNGTQPDEA